MAQINESGARIHGTGVQAIYALRHFAGPLPDEGELLYVEYDASSEDVQIEGNLAIDVSFEDRKPIRGTLFVIANYVADVLDWFAPVFPRAEANGH